LTSLENGIEFILPSTEEFLLYLEGLWHAMGLRRAAQHQLQVPHKHTWASLRLRSLSLHLVCVPTPRA
jgi:hypothetical protein